MFNGIKRLNIITLLKVPIKLPFNASSEFPMYVSKDLKKGTIIFSIPLYNWSHEMEVSKNISTIIGPSGFNHPKSKRLLISAMNHSLSIIENK